MSKEEFLQLESTIKISGKSIKSYCREQSISYSTYNYWRKKYHMPAIVGQLAPVSFTHPSVGMETVRTSSVVIQLPTGVQIEFAQSDDAVALQVLTGMCSSYVLSK